MNITSDEMNIMDLRSEHIGVIKTQSITTIIVMQYPEP